MDGLGVRIKTAADALGGLDALSSRLTDVSRRTLSDWANDRTEPRASSIAEICDLTGARHEWLISGEGEPFKRPTQVVKELAELAGGDVSEAEDGTRGFLLQAVKALTGGGDQAFGAGLPEDGDLPSDMISIPRFDEVRPSAGPGLIAASEVPSTRVAFEKHWLVEIGIQASAAVILPAQGDSMEPTIMNGSPMLVDTSKTDIQSGFIYVIAVENDLLVKRVRRRLDGMIELISDNRAYEPETLDRTSVGQLRVIGRVFAAVCKF